MNRPCGSDSLAALMTIRPATEDHGTRKNRVFDRGFQSPFDEDDCAEESGHVSEKKRRLGSDQVKALEKNFELDNKLEPERKVELARELGLQPRQVAVWFQNRRARWKTKQLEIDYDALKSSYDALKLKFDSLRRENEDLLEKIEEAKAKLFEEENTESNVSAKEETTMAYSIGIDKTSPPSDNPFPVESESEDFLCRSFINNNGGESGNEMSLFTAHSKDGSSDDSDSSAILNSPKEAAISSHPAPCNYPKLVSSSSLKTKGSSSSGSSLIRFQIQKSCQPQQDVKMEEQNLFGGEEGCSFFSADQAPTLQWCYEDHQWD